MKQRRQFFVKEIRRRHKQEIISHIRNKKIDELSKTDYFDHLFEKSFTERQMESYKDISQMFNKTFCSLQSNDEDIFSIIYQQLNKILSREDKSVNDDMGQSSLYCLIQAYFQAKLQGSSRISHWRDLAEKYRHLMLIVETNKEESSASKNKQNILSSATHNTTGINHILNQVLLKIKVKLQSFGDENIQVFQLNQSINHFFQSWIKSSLVTFQTLDNSQEIDKDVFELLNFRLKEIHSLLKQCSGLKATETMLESIFDDRMVKILVFLARCYKISSKHKNLITTTFSLIAQMNISIIYERILNTGYLDFIRMYLVCEHAFKEDFRQIEDQSINSIQIVQNMLTFVYQSYQFDKTDWIWQQGLIQQMKVVMHQVMNKTIRQNFIRLICACIIDIKTQQSLDVFLKADIFEWVLEVLENHIGISFRSEDDEQIISIGLDVIRFFFAQGGQGNSCSNMYFLKFKYLFGEDILNKCEKGREFLLQIKDHSHDNQYSEDQV